MSVELTGLRLPLANFALEVDARLVAPVTAVFGPSGSGKTSLLEIIAGLRRPAAGAVRVDGRILTDTAAPVFVPPQRRAIGYVMQDGALFPHLDVRDNLLYGRPAAAKRDHRLTLEHVVEVLEISELTRRTVGTLSGGEQRRVALGRALLAAPRLLLLDEPLAGLDEALRRRLLPYLVRVRDEFRIPMIFVTHSPDEVVALCAEVLVLERGCVVRRGCTGELFGPSPEPRLELRSAVESPGSSASR